MENTYVQSLVNDCRIQRNLSGYSTTDYTDTLPLSYFLFRIPKDKLTDETFDFTELSNHASNLYRLFVTIDKLGGMVNKEVVNLILQIEAFAAQQTEAKGISLVQSMLKLMTTQFLGNALTSKPTDWQTQKVLVFDEEDRGKEYSDKYFSFGHKGKRYIVKTDTFDLTDILAQL